MAGWSLRTWTLGGPGDIWVGGKSRGEGGTVTASGVSNEAAYAPKCTAGQV